MDNPINSKELIPFIDQQKLSKKSVEELDIEIYCEYSNQQWKINFVGFIVQRNSIIISFPKNYFDIQELNGLSQEQLQNHINILIRYFQKETSTLNSLFGGTEPINSFPIPAYLSICRYYFSFGLYFNTTKNVVKGYGGVVNWKKTMQNSNRYISNGNLIFTPFILNKHKSEDTFITECMKYALTDGYRRFGSLFNVGVPYSDTTNTIGSLRALTIIRKLKENLFESFKDSEKALILSLIEYFEWKATNNDRMIFVTTNFDNAWEKLVESVLNNYLEGFLALEPSLPSINKLHLEGMKFTGQVSQEVKRSDSNEIGSYSVRYDHLGINKFLMILLDSKYYFEKSGLDYKQFSYNYILSGNSQYSDEKKLINGLVMPTKDNSSAEVMLDWRGSDNKLYKKVYIINFYLNVQKVIELYTSI